MTLPYHIGCPMWANKAWRGQALPEDARPETMLEGYAAVCSAVEGNTTFYGIPSPERARNWAAQVGSDFHFCFKIPRIVSHDRGLRDVTDPVREFLAFLEPFGEKLGPTFLQLPPSFGAENLEALSRFLPRWPTSLPLAVEPRHPDFFAGGDVEARFDDLLRRHGMDRVLFDTVNFFGCNAEGPGMDEARRKKPQVPRKTTVTGERPFLRYVGLPDVDADTAGIAFWADQAADWIDAGLKPHLFMHQVPEDDLAPVLVRMLQESLHQRRPHLPPSKAWPKPKPKETQMTLF